MRIITYKLLAVLFIFPVLAFSQQCPPGTVGVRSASGSSSVGPDWDTAAKAAAAAFMADCSGLRISSTVPVEMVASISACASSAASVFPAELPYGSVFYAYEGTVNGSCPSLYNNAAVCNISFVWKRTNSHQTQNITIQVTVNTSSCSEPEPPSCEPGVESSFELEASEPASTTCHDGCEQVLGPVSAGFMGIWGVTYKTTGQNCTTPTPGLTAVSDPEGCFDANGINFCSSPSGAPDEQCGTFNGKLICSQGTAAGPADKPPSQGCITKGDVTACTSDAPNTAPPRPSTEQGGSTPTTPAGNMSGPAGSTDIHIGGFFGGSGDGDGNGGDGDGDGDGDECPEGQTCTGKVKVKQIKDGFGGEFKTAQDQRLTDLEQELSGKLATVRNEMGALFGSLSESGGQLPDYSFSIPYPGGSIPVNWNLGNWNIQLNIIALAIMFLAVVIGISIILGD